MSDNNEKMYYFLVSCTYQHKGKVNFESIITKNNKPFITGLELSQIEDDLVDVLFRTKNIVLDNESNLVVTGVSHLGYMTEDEYHGKED